MAMVMMMMMVMMDSNDDIDDDEEEAAVLQCSDRGFLPPMKGGYCRLFTEHHHRRSRHSLNWFQWMSIVQSKVQHLLWYQFGALHYWLRCTLLVNSNSLHFFSKLTSQYNRVKIRMEFSSAKYPIACMDCMDWGCSEARSLVSQHARFWMKCVYKCIFYIL